MSTCICSFSGQSKGPTGIDAQNLGFKMVCLFQNPCWNLVPRVKCGEVLRCLWGVWVSWGSIFLKGLMLILQEEVTSCGENAGYHENRSYEISRASSGLCALAPDMILSAFLQDVALTRWQPVASVVLLDFSASRTVNQDKFPLCITQLIFCYFAIAMANRQRHMSSFRKKSWQTVGWRHSPLYQP